MSICVPVKDLKDTSAFTATVLESAEPVIVTKNGRESFIAMSPSQFEALRLEGARSRLYQMVDEAEADIAAGKVYDSKGTADYLKARYAL